MKVIIAGSRTINNLSLLCVAIEKAADMADITPITEVVSGGATGVDRLGETWAANERVPVKQFIPDWVKGRHMGKLRNIEMAEYADALIALWDGHSKGTRHMIKTMDDKGKPVFVYKIHAKRY